MAKGRLPLAVPKLTPYEVKLGELCALDLWDGIDYQTGKELKVRDEVFLANFGTPAASLSSGKKSSLNVSVQNFHTFIIVAGLKSQYQTESPRVFRRLQTLRRLSHEQEIKSFFTGDA